MLCHSVMGGGGGGRQRVGEDGFKRGWSVVRGRSAVDGVVWIRMWVSVDTSYNTWMSYSLGWTEGESGGAGLTLVLGHHVESRPHGTGEKLTRLRELVRQMEEFTEEQVGVSVHVLSK